jgi:hypothetical protein
MVSDEMGFSCELCGERFDDRRALIDHGIEEHQDGDPEYGEPP